MTNKIAQVVKIDCLGEKINPKALKEVNDARNRVLADVERKRNEKAEKNSKK